jgi:hypothetical protein
MATLDSLQFEMERRVILFKPTTTMPDLSQLGYNADPNLIVSPSTPGEQLIYFSPNNTRYVNYDASGNTITEWFKKAQPNGWLPLGSDASTNIYGTDSSTWQLDMSNSGVILQSDGSSNLTIKDSDGDLATLIIGNLVIGNITGYLRAIDGSIFADASISTLKSGTGLLIGDDNTNPWIINHNLNTANHMIAIYDACTNDLIYPEVNIEENSDTITFFAPPETSTNYRAVIMGF